MLIWQLKVLTITLTDAQWSAYQDVSDDISEDRVVAWLKERLIEDYRIKLENADIRNATIISTRNTKVDAFRE